MHVSDSIESHVKWQIGPFAACPNQQRGCIATFSNFVVSSREPMLHDSNLH
jgi:hypothetical protein